MFSFVLRENRQSLGSFFYLQPVRIVFPFGDSTVTSFFLKTTVQFASYMGPTPMSVLVKDVMMYPVVGKSATNLGMGRISLAEDFSTCPSTVPTLIVAALVSVGPCGEVG